MTFNEGVRLSVEAGNAGNAGRQQVADSMNNAAIAKFRRTMEMDSLHPVVRAALGHSYYIAGAYPDAAAWLRRAIAFGGPDAAIYRELGLSQVGMGLLPQGKLTIDTALRLDTSVQQRRAIIADLSLLADRTWAQNERKLSVGIGRLALGYDSANRQLQSLVATRSTQLADTATAK